MAANYMLMVPFVLKWEAGYVNDPDDSGGATNRGVTFKTFKSLSLNVLGIQPTEYNFRKLSKDQAARIFQYYWNVATNINSIKSQAISEVITSWFWGSGQLGLINFQKMLKYDFGKNISIDGKIGNETTEAINSLNEKKLFSKAVENREKFFRELAQKRPKDQKFLEGWLNRLNDFKNRHENLIDGYSATALILISLFLFLTIKNN